MGNVPAKEGRSRSNSYSGSNIIYHEPLSRGARRNTTASYLGHGDLRRLKNSEDRERQRERHYMNLIVRLTENIDGGYLAPYGTYKLNLDYNTDIVKNLIIGRRLAPFYTPLLDFDESWLDDELYIILNQIPLHSIDAAYSEEEVDDIDNHKIHKSTNYYRRQELKARLKALIEKVKELQKEEEARFETLKASAGSPDVPSRDLLLRLYRNATECPICFLYYPNNFNITRCCRQPICTECFVQIKRLDPHPPHDDPAINNTSELPHTLISESANCPYCAVPDFGVTYEPPKDIQTGINSTKPSHYRAPLDSAILSSPEKESTLTVKHVAHRRSSVAADSPTVVTTDLIRPDWEQKLVSARNKLARKAATATAIHASNLIIPGEENRLETFQSVEDRMLEQALRLSLLEEEERKRREEKKRESSKQ